MKSYRGIMLDVDNTLLDFSAAERTGVYEVLAAFGAQGSGELLDVYSRINAGLWQAYEKGEIERQEILDTRFARFFSQIGVQGDGKEAERLYREHLNTSAIPVPGAGELLKWLSGRYPLYVVTNGVSETQFSRLSEAGFLPYFRGVFVSEDAGFQKPKREFFDYCFAKIREERGEEAAEPSEYLVVGDSLTSDILGGRTAGTATCWFNRFGEPGREDILPDYEIRSLGELADLLAG